MPRRSSYRTSSDEGKAGIFIFFLCGVYAIYRWTEALPRLMFYGDRMKQLLPSSIYSRRALRSAAVDGG